MAEEKEKKPTIVLSLESMERIQDRVGQWMILDEHWTEHNLNRYEQLDHAKRLCQEIKAEIKKAYETSPYREN